MTETEAILTSIAILSTTALSGWALWLQHKLKMEEAAMRAVDAD